MRDTLERRKRDGGRIGGREGGKEKGRKEDVMETSEFEHPEGKTQGCGEMEPRCCLASRYQRPSGPKLVDQRQSQVGLRRPGTGTQ